MSRALYPIRRQELDLRLPSRVILRPPGPVFETPTPGGATAAGLSPTARVTTAPGGASGRGRGATYAQEVLADGPAVYYRMQESTGQLQDSSGNANHTTDVDGTPTYSQTTPLTTDPEDKAIQFNGTERFTAPDHSSLDLGDTFTVEFWVKRNSLDETDRLETVVTKRTGGYRVHLNFFGATTCRPQLEKSQEGGILGSTTDITDTNWHHVVATKSGAFAKLYLDGADVSGTHTPRTCVNNAEPLEIGAEFNTFQLLTAQLDEVAVYPTVLPYGRVQAHYAAGLTGGGPAAVVAVTAGGATAGGLAPTEITEGGEQVPPGGATAGGFGPSARTGVVSSGALAGGQTPTIKSPVTIQGALAAGLAATAVATSTSGGALAGAQSPFPRVPLTIQGATAGGVSPIAPLIETPTPGGAIAGANTPTIRVGVTRGKAPSSAVVDDFNRADENPMTGWTDFPSGNGLEIISNQAASGTTGGQDGAYFNTPIPDPDVEVTVTIATLPSALGSTVLYARSDPDAGGIVGDNYAVRHTITAGTHTIFIARHDATISTTLAQYSQNLAAGDGLGIRCVGSTIEAWARLSGTWTLIGQAVDTTYPGGGTHNKVAIAHAEVGAPVVRWDDFAAGSTLKGLASAGGIGPTIKIPLTLQGALAGGRAPQVPVYETPTPGGAIAAGRAPFEYTPLIARDRIYRKFVRPRV